MLRAIGYGLLAGLIFSCLSQLSGCNAKPGHLPEPAPQPYQVNEPDKFGVVCYQAYQGASYSFSCVKVQEGRTR